MSVLKRGQGFWVEKVRVLALALGVVSAAGLVGGCVNKPPKETNATAKHPTIKFAEGNGFVQFVNRDTVPNNVYGIRGVKEIIVRDDVLLILDISDENYVVPQHRVVYAGVEIK
jgi:hypothetical protein